jgi:uncharacterized membrane protein
MPTTMCMAMVCFGQAMFAQTSMGVLTGTPISIQIMARAIVVVILEAILGVTTTGGTQIIDTVEVMIPIAIHIIMEVYGPGSNNW